MSEEKAAPIPGRIMSVDALRGFDMFWITGGKHLILGIIALCSIPFPAWLERQFEHVPWVGFVAWDLIMPLFLFIVGTSMPFSFKHRVDENRGGAKLYLRIFRRVIILWFLGMVAQGNLLSFDPSQFHFYSNTLQSIASGYLVAAFVILYLPIAGQLAVTAALLLGFWLLMTFVPFPGHAAGTLDPHANLAMFVDEFLLGRFRDGTTYTWILSSMGFAASVLLGVQSGHILMSSKKPFVKFFSLLGAGVLCLGLGWAWSIWFPIIKHIWTSSMVLWAAGLSYILLALFYLVVDICGFRKWAFVFVVIGMNAIVAYMGEPFLTKGCDYVFDFVKNETAMNLLHITEFCAFWAILYLLYRKKWFLRI